VREPQIWSNIGQMRQMMSALPIASHRLTLSSY